MNKKVNLVECILALAMMFIIILAASEPFPSESESNLIEVSDDNY